MTVSHDGIVSAVRQGLVTVTVTVNSACHQCHAHGSCGFAESKDKTLEIATPEWERYHVGDAVVVTVNESLGLGAALLAYLLPAALLLAVLMPLLHLMSEPLAVLLTLAALALYYMVLYLCRNKLQKKFTIGLSHPSAE